MTAAEERTRLAAVVAVLAVGVSASAGCRGPAVRSAAGRPLVLISIDTLRSDHLRIYGYSALQTPAFDALARDSIVFERAFSHYPLTLPSHASVFTGLLPPGHGVRNNKGYALADAHETLAERMRAAGYQTAGFVSSMVLRADTGIAQGFDTYDAPGDQGRRMFSQRKGEITLARALAWLDSVKRGERFFLFLHLFDPHTPYDPPPPFDQGHASPYDGEIAYTDSVLGRFTAALRERGLYDDTLIVLMSDHGEGLGDHVEREHGLLLYREALQVPLFVKLPGRRRAGERTKAPAALSDVGATALAELGLPSALGDGKDLLGERPPAADRAIYGETWFTREQYGWSELRSVIRGDAHYIDAPRPELYDWARDPGEREDLAPRVAVPASFTAVLAAVGHGAATTKAVTREEEERLAALGYVGGPATADPAAPSGRGPDPKDHVAQAVELWDAMQKIGKSDSLEPENRVKRLLGELGLRREYVSRTIAYNMLRAGRPAAALEVLQPFADSQDPATHETLGEILLALGRPAPGRAAFLKALALAPNDAAALRGLGMVSLAAGQLGEARERLERAVAADASLADAWNALGVARAETGDLPGAITAWRKTVEIDPEAGLAWFNLGLCLEKTGDRKGAAEALERYVPLAQGAERAHAEAMLRRLRGA
jgi:arylsulfatase A-like enzyme/tetratricopeptide (TPR) repeat protein